MYVNRGLFFLTVALLLAAVPAAGQILWDQGNCTDTSATVAIGSVSYDCSLGRITASGTWSVTSAVGIHLEYSIDGVLYQSETRYGSNGTWSFVDDVVLSDASHTFRIDGYPVVDDGSVETTCWQHGTNVSQGFSVACVLSAWINECSWSCSSKNLCYGTCPGAVSGGTAPYYYTWGVEDPEGNVDWEPRQGPTFKTVTESPQLNCRAGYAGIYDVIVLKAEDSSGQAVMTYAACGVNM